MTLLTVPMLRILLIDDNPADRLLAMRELKREFADLQVEPIGRAEEFERALAAGQFDVTITDYQLRWADGLTVLRELKTRYEEHPVIMFTNSGSQEVAVEAMKSGLDDYIVKSPSQYIRLRTAVRMAIERVEAQRKAAGLERRFQALLNRLDVGVYRLTSSGAFLEGNPAFLRLLGLSPLIKISANQTLEPYFRPVDYAELLSQLGQETGRLEVQLRQADKTTLWVRISKTFTRVDDITIIDGLIEDISDRKQAEAERESLLACEQTARAEAEAANRIKDEFLAVLSHELRTPLNPILGWSKLLRTRKFDPAKTAQALEVIERNAQLQTQLIEDLLDISRILQGKLILNAHTVDLESTIQAAMETVRLSAEAKSIQMQTIFEPDMGQVSGDPNRLQQVFWNLLSNAIKFTPERGRVNIRLERFDSQAQITVSDTGKGIHPDFLPHVFDHFRQADTATTRQFGGLGLGLAIVRHLVELHGGTVQVESQGEGRGSAFIVRLPWMPTQQKTWDRRQLSAPKLKGVRVLVVDDDADSREFIAFLLGQYEANVTAVVSAGEALVALTEFNPDVLLSDIGMPDMDGYALIRQVRALPPETGGQTPAIALTAYAGEINYQQALSAGFQKHLSKPVAPAELIAAISSLTFRLEHA